MKEFPTILNVKNKDRFSEIYYNRVMCYARKAIYEHVIHHEENSYFDLEQFGKSYFNGNKNRVSLVGKLFTLLIVELEQLGWKCKLSFGGTALFIYSTPEQPPSCWDDGLT